MPAQRAVFFAVAYSYLTESKSVDSEHLLLGLMRDEDSRAQTIFGLREHFPLYSVCPCKFPSYAAAPKPEAVLTDSVKRILARTGWEADAMRDYWIDTEHLLLGILAEKTCTAAQHLTKADLTLKCARRRVVESRFSRPYYGAVPDPWNLQSPLERLLFKWRMRKYLS